MYTSNWSQFERLNNKTNNLYTNIFIELFHLDCCLDKVRKGGNLSFAFKLKQKQFSVYYTSLIFKYCK